MPIEIATDETATANDGPGRRPPGDPARRHVLVVDDDAISRGLAGRTLRRAGFEVVEVESGEVALQSFADRPADLVLLDVMMGGIDGFECCRRLRAMPGGRQVPVIMLTGLNDNASIEQSYEAGATDFIAKPIQWPLLAHRARYCLRAAAAAVAMQRSRESLARAQRMVHMGSWELDADGRMRCSDELAHIFGLDPAAVHDTSSAALLAQVRAVDRDSVRRAREALQRDGQAYQLSYAIDRADGQRRTLFEQAAATSDEPLAAPRAEGITQDITDRVEAERRVRHLALHDSLTGLPNRDFFLSLAAPALEQARRGGALCAVLHLDIDSFKSINDAFGHDAGDQVLREVADRLRACTRNYDLTSMGQAEPEAELVARVSGNAFTVMLVNLLRADHAAAAAQRMLRAVAQPFALRGQELQLSACVGIALFPGDAADAGELVQFAEQAQYEAKKAGRGALRFFDEAINTQARERLAREGELRRAIAQGELRLHLQPKFDAASRAIIGAEALVRWQHPQRGLVPPGDFVPLAEQTGLIHPLTDWVLDQACALIERWARQGLVTVPVAVNVASPCFLAVDLVERLQARMQRHSLRNADLVLEVTESLLMADVERAVARLHALRAHGFMLSLDDFGTGYSSLAYLKRFPIDELKIDRAFVRDVEHGGKDGALVAAIVTLGRMLEMQVVAEGVETEAQAAALRSHGCRLHQGFLYARPMPAEAFEQLLARR